jgi:O-antigen/teichoic acid export membrane protein
LPAQKNIVDVFSTEHLQLNLKARSIRGGVLTLSSQGAQFLLQSISTVVMARLLTPADFGLVAMVTAVTGLGQAFADLGLSEATIQREKISHQQVSTLFWINVGIGLLLMLITIALAPVLSWFYHDPRLRLITLVLSVTFLIGGLKVQHDALLRRQMRFSSLAIRDVASYILAIPLAIILAWRGAGYWALVAFPLALNGTALVLCWLMTRWIPGWPRRDAKIGSLVVFGAHVAASYLIANTTRSSDGVLIGWRWGAGPLGLYSRAYNLLLLPVRQLSSPARSVAVPAFSRTQDEPERFARYYLGAISLIMWIGTPLFAFLFAAAEPVIVLTLGNQWREAAPVFQILAISALAQLLFDSTIWVFVSRGESKRLLKLLVIISPIMFTSFAIGLPFGIKGVALSGSLTLVAIFPCILKFAYRGTRLTLRRLGEAMLCPALLSLLAVGSAEAVSDLFGPSTIAVRLLRSVLGFVAPYLLSAFIPKVRKEFESLYSLAKHHGFAAEEASELRV